MAQGMTIGTPVGTIPANTAQEADTLLMFVNQISVPSDNDSHDNIGHVQLNTGDGMTPNTMRAMASVHVHNGHNDHIPFNTASTPVRKGESYDWKLATAGDGCKTAEAAWTYSLTLPSGVSPGAWEDRTINTSWIAEEDGFLVGYIEEYGSINQVIVTLTEPTGNKFQISGASQIWGTDVYLPGNTFSVAIYKGCTYEITPQSYNGGPASSGLYVNAFWIGFGATQVFESAYTQLSVGETYQAQTDLFLMGLAATTQDNTRISLSAGSGADYNNLTEVVVGASVNCGKNRWLQYNSFLLPVQRNKYYNTTLTGSGTPGVTLYCLPVLSIK